MATLAYHRMCVHTYIFAGRWNPERGTDAIETLTLSAGIKGCTIATAQTAIHGHRTSQIHMPDNEHMKPPLFAARFCVGTILLSLFLLQTSRLYYHLRGNKLKYLRWR